MQEIRGRYPNEEEFADDLARNGLDETSFAAALERELKVEAILEKVGTRAESVSDMDVELYYQYHPEQFRRPETRLARHILITINDSIAENTREAAHAAHRGDRRTAGERTAALRGAGAQTFRMPHRAGRRQTGRPAARQTFPGTG